MVKILEALPIPTPRQSKRLADFGCLLVSMVCSISDVLSSQIKAGKVKRFAGRVAIGIGAIVRALPRCRVAQAFRLGSVLVERRTPGCNGLDVKSCRRAAFQPLGVDNAQGFTEMVGIAGSGHLYSPMPSSAFHDH